MMYCETHQTVHISGHTDLLSCVFTEWVEKSEYDDLKADRDDLRLAYDELFQKFTERGFPPPKRPLGAPSPVGNNTDWVGR